MCRYGSLWVHLIWSLLSFLDVYIHVFHQIWEVFSHYFFKYFLYIFLSSFSETSTMYMLVSLVVSHWSLGLCSLFFSIFLSVPLYLQFLLFCIQVSWFFLLLIQIWIWIPLVNFSFQLLYFSAPWFCLCWFPVMFSISLLLFLFCSYISLFLTLYTFFLLFFEHLNDDSFNFFLDSFYGF